MEKHITLFSNDEALIRLVEESVTTALGSEFTLARGHGSQVPLPDELCIWDFVPDETVLPSTMDRGEWKTHLFLLQRKHLAALQALTGISNLNILLKPVNRAALRAFLGGYALRREPRGGYTGSPGKLRSERDEILQVLMQANLKLQEFNQDCANFLARSIHDFRAPLTTISGYCALLLEEALDPLTSEQREVLERMQHSVKRLTRAANSMLQLRGAESAETGCGFEPADIRDCISQALQEVSTTVEHKRISVTVDVGPSPEGLLFEKSQMEQALVSLLDNACKFTPKGGVIEIRGYPFFWERRINQAIASSYPSDRRMAQDRSANSLRLDIRDSGPGIPASHTDRIFREYTSYSGGQDRSGAGLGLAVCRMILSQHGGRIWAESSAGGAVFSLVLPIQRTDALISQGEKHTQNNREPRFAGD